MTEAKLTKLQKFILGLVIFTGLSHIMYSYGWDSEILGLNLGFWFVVNGIGYFVLAYLRYFHNGPEVHTLNLSYVLGAWTAGSILAWAIFHTSSDGYDTLLDASLINKSVEFIILVLLFLDIRNKSSST